LTPNHELAHTALLQSPLLGRPTFPVAFIGGEGAWVDLIGHVE
jgi:hypothetical protein